MATSDHAERPTEEADQDEPGGGCPECDGEVDPTKHRVVKTVPTADAKPGEIVDVYQPGYRQDDRILREAQVVVGHARRNVAVTHPIPLPSVCATGASHDVVLSADRGAASGSGIVG